MKSPYKHGLPPVVHLSYIPLGGVFAQSHYICPKCQETWAIVHDGTMPTSKVILYDLSIAMHKADHANKEADNVRN